MEKTRNIRLNVCLAARSGPMRNALLSFLRTMPDVKVVLLSEDLSKAMQFLSQQKPDVVVIEAHGSSGNWLRLVENMQKNVSGVRSLVFVETMEQQRTALNAGASQAIFQGMPGEWVKQAVRGKATGISSKPVEKASFS